MTDRRVTVALPSAWTAGLAGLVALFTIVAFRFAAEQSLWTDEATQLSGLTLGFADQLRWLAGSLPHAFAVPIDRTPPLSYWLGSVWQRAFGDGILTARHLSVCLSVGSLFVLWAIARQYLEHRIALISVALLALSPNFVAEAAEIRAYAAFILFSTMLLYVYLRLLAAKPAPSTLDLWAFAIAATLCSYTHFFGIVIANGAFLSLLASYLSAGWRTGLGMLQRAKWPILLYILSLGGVIPFILAAVKASAGGNVATAMVSVPLGLRSYDIIKLVYRLFAHQSMLGVPGLSVAALLAGVTLLVFATIPGANPRCRQLLLYFLVNFALITLAGLTTSSFGAFAPTYNVWMLPVTALLSATALTHRIRKIRAVSTLCICVLLVADCYAALRLSTAGAIYAHTRSTVVKSAIDTAGPSNVIVLYANDAPAIYFAMIYNYRGKLRQYIPEAGNVHLIGASAGSSSPWICDRSANTLVVAEDHELSAEALQFQIAHPGVHTQAYLAIDQFLAVHHADLDSKWTLVSRDEYLAQSALAVAIFRSRTTNVSSSSVNCDVSLTGNNQ